jgi:23S rRNA pseudouridine2605 synthase
VTDGPAAPVRLQKLIAEAGRSSRRAAERLIVEGRVTVNGEVIRQLGATATPGRDLVCVDGEPLHPPRSKTYLLMHKPLGVVSSARDPHAVRTVTSLLPPDAPRLFPVGRLDRDSEGLLLLTDDGDLTERLLHPRYEIEREYAVLVRGDLSTGTLGRLREGTTVEGAHVRPRAVKLGRQPAFAGGATPPGTGWLSLTLTEGRKREVRVLCAAAGLQVLRLIRVRFGPLSLGELPPGHTRPLSEREVAALKAGTTSTASM